MLLKQYLIVCFQALNLRLRLNRICFSWCLWWRRSEGREEVKSHSKLLQTPYHLHRDNYSVQLSLDCNTVLTLLYTRQHLRLGAIFVRYNWCALGLFFSPKCNIRWCNILWTITVYHHLKWCTDTNPNPNLNMFTTKNVLLPHHSIGVCTHTFCWVLEAGYFITVCSSWHRRCGWLTLPSFIPPHKILHGWFLLSIGNNGKFICVSTPL